MSPSSHIGEDLRLTAALFTPEKTSGIKSFPIASAKTNTPDIFRTPMVIAFLLIASEIELVLYLVPFYKLAIQ